MGKVMFGLSVSLDGFIADKNDDVSLVFAWFASAWDRFYEVVGDSLNMWPFMVPARSNKP